ncbi:preprotein translocase subunit SecG [Dongia rigui]|uniref:Protein-export membrane protein SecG n=1 Tax=Dongia rigui TaxID=940149 RepID=A0ABU5E393_9PROT|nr:preprotein translocase subunit SecG [Dongia rigui]MDY0874045.1 preprotein translocase subunit SecG [Dongia rigui]
MLGALFPIVLAIHVIITIFLIGIILTQKNEGGMGGLGGGAAGGMAGFLSGRQQANLLTKATRWLAVGFFCTSLFLAYSDSHRAAKSTIVGATPVTTTPAAPAGDLPADSGVTNTTPTAPAQPAAPSGQ